MSNTPGGQPNVQDKMASAMESAKEAAQNVTTKVADFFQGNPFDTPVGKKIELATDATRLATENWGLNMEICDFINSTNEGGRDAIRAIKKRLQTQIGKNNATVMYTLTVLETCVKNCDQRFKALVCQKDFVNELVKLIGPKFDAPQVVQERVLSLIQSWADTFRGNPALVGVNEVYDELRQKGVEFPPTDFDSMAPILTPKRTVFPEPKQPTTPPTQEPQLVQEFPRPQQQSVQPLFRQDFPENSPFVPITGPVAATPEQLSKLRGELDLVQINLTVLRDLLGVLAPGQETQDELQLLDQLYKTCKEMQKRVQELIPVITNDEVTYELLVVNDEFYNVFEKYNRYMTNRASKGETSASTASAPSATSATGGGDDLIKFEDSFAPVTDQLKNMKVHEGTQGTSGSKGQTNENYIHDQAEVGIHKVAYDKAAPVSDQEAQEMAQWLEANKDPGAVKPKEDDGL
uniref:Target of Myb protein 1 n=1 Tax=Acrobeloides nanus TaxID=290746 RepID=A0A914C3U0_9BILA